MSTNTTSTSDRLGSASPTLSSAQEPTQQEGTQKYQGVPVSMSAVPDAAVIARLANEFFAALPGGAAPPRPTVPAVPGIPGNVPPAAIPDFPREAFSASNAPNPSALAGSSVQSIPGGPQLPSSPPSGALTEADFRAIAASLAGAMPLVSQATALPVSSTHSPDDVGGGPWAAPPQIPPAAEMYSFPGVPAMPSSPPTGPPSGSDLAAVPSAAVIPGAPALPIADSGDSGRTDPWAAAPHFAGLNDVFSFPRVPGASVPGVPEVQASQPSVPASQPALGVIPPAPVASLPALNLPASNTPESIPAIPTSATPIAAPADNAESGDAKKAVYPGVASKFPSVSELYSFPGVPGAQSLPGVPVPPSSAPTEPPKDTDLHATPNATAGVPAMPQVPGVRMPSITDWSGDVSEEKKSVPQGASLPQGIESVEFRPDLSPAELGTGKRPLDPRLIRQDFPILQERVNGRPLIWLDNAATTQKPNAVIDRLSYFYRHENSNIHRAAHTLAARATDAYESAREKTRRFLNASSSREIVFVRGTTEGINLIAQAWGRRYVQKDDEVVITWLEHHANIVPWQQLCSEKGARLRVAPVNDRGEIILEEYEKLLSPRTRIVSFSQVSNALGTITPAREMVEMAHRHGARVVVDGAQAVSHMRVDVQALDCDFYVFSGHKVFAPTGIGVVYGKLDVLNTMPPWQGGGNMIADVTFEKTTYQAAPARFEAGTGNIADAVGLGAALDYVDEVGMESISAYEHELLLYATAGLLTVPGLRLIGTAREKAGVLSFVLDDVRTEDVGAALSQEGIAVRSGHHCAQPILRRMGVESSVRPSLAFYNTREEIDALVAALLRIKAGRNR
jgi:cysteine desulfurase / selenocysteine lyase